MKTIEQWLSTLDEPYRTRAIIEVGNNGLQYEKVPKLSFAIGSFNWQQEIRGKQSLDWYGLFKRAQKQESIPFYSKYLTPIGAEVKKSTK